MKIFIVPSWYPSRINPKSGVFFVDHCRILQRCGNEITVIVNIIHSFNKLFTFRNLNKIQNGILYKYGLKTYRKETFNWFPKIQRFTFNLYRKQLIKMFEKAFHDQGTPDFVYLFSSLWAGAALGLWLRKRSIPYIVSEHLKEFLLTDGFTSFQQKCINISFVHASRILATSTSLKSSIEKRFPTASGKTIIVPNPANISAYKIDSINHSENKYFTFVSVALLRKEKRIDILLKSFARLVSKQSNVKLKLVGDGPEKADLEQLVSQLDLGDHIEFLGYLDKQHVSKVLQMSNVLILSSEVETFGVALVEAMASGLPVIATRCGGPNDIITPETGILVEVNNEDALFNAMMNIIQNYDKYSHQKIREIAETKYGDQTYSQSIQNIYNNLKIFP